MTILICSFLITSEAKHFFISLFPLRLFFLHISFSYFLFFFNRIISFNLIKLAFICSMYTAIFFLSGLIFYFFLQYIVRKIFTLIESALSVIPLGFVLFVCYFKISYLTPGHIICLKNCMTLIFHK